MIGPVRNHPIILVKNSLSLVVLVIVAILFVVGSEFDDGLVIGIIAVCFAVVLFLIMLRVWQKTSFTFTDTEILVNKDTLFKQKKTIPYTKIASTNIVRSIFDRIAGTSTLSFNANSGVNASVPEAVVVVKKDLASRIYETVHSGLTGDSGMVSEEQIVIERPNSVISYNLFDIIFHGFFSSSTWSLIYSTIFFVYSVYGFFVDPTAMGGALITALMFIMSLVMPVVTKVTRYFNFRVYRIDDTIYLDHGMFRKYHSEFDISKINSVKIQKTFFSRILGRCYLQAEVVGINAVEGDVTPTICLLSSEKMIRTAMNELLPEFIYDGETLKQPKEAKMPICIRSLAALVVVISITVLILLIINGFFDPELKINEGLLVLTNVVVSVFAVVLMILFVFGGYVSLRTKDYIIGEDLFTFTNGVVDRTTAIVQYDRVQAVYMRAGPIARRYSLAKCKVSLLSASGGSRIGSGYFRTDNLDDIHEIMLKRIECGICNRNNKRI